jgi:hypothetical protein
MKYTPLRFVALLSLFTCVAGYTVFIVRHGSAPNYTVPEKETVTVLGCQQGRRGSVSSPPGYPWQ